MILRWLLTTYLKQAAQEKIMAAVADAARGQTRAGAKDADDGEPLPPCEIVFVFALGIEAGGLVDLLSDAVATRYPTFVERAGTLNGRRVALIETGVGREAAARATADVIALHRPHWIISAGFAGALVDELRRGHFLLADSVADVSGKTIEFGLRRVEEPPDKANWHVGRLLTVDKIVRKESQRRALAAEHQALACDMETLGVAEVCEREKTRLVSVRVISDAVNDKLPKEVAHLITRKSLAAQLGAATAALLARPSSALDLWQLREDAQRASDRLGHFLAGVVEQLPGGDNSAENVPKI